jgi:hypothetical protein
MIYPVKYRGAICLWQFHRASAQFGIVFAALAVAIAALLVFPPRTEAAPTDGLVGHWTFDGSDVTTTVADRSGNGNSGYLFNVSTSSAKKVGKLGQALFFDTTNDLVKVANQASLNFTSALTLSAWIKKRGAFPTGGQSRDIIGKSTDPAQFNQWQMQTIDDELALYFCTTSNDASCVTTAFQYTTDATNMQPETWYHVVTTWDDSSDTVVLYVNGVPQSASDTGNDPVGSAHIDSTTGDVYIGEMGAGIGSDMTIDDARVYNRALTPSEVKQLYLHGQALKKPPNNLGLVGYWSFNEGTSTVATDFSGNGNHGTFEAGNGSLPTWTNGRRGYAVNLSPAVEQGERVNMSAPSVLQPTAAVTVAAWVNISQTFESSAHIAGAYKDDDGYRLALSPTTCVGFAITFHVWAGDDYCASYPLTSFSATSTWHHVVGTYDGDTILLYLDGVQVASDTSPSSDPIQYDSNTPFCVGNRASSQTACNQSSTNFSGLVDEVRVYNRVLSPSEVATLAQSGAVKFTTSSVALQSGSTLTQGLVGHWPFDGADVTDRVYDRSGQNNHAYFVGGATSSARAIGKLGQALEFDNSNDYVRTTTETSFDFDTTSPFSLSAWVYRNSMANSDVVMGKVDVIRGYSLFLDGTGRVSFIVANDTLSTIFLQVDSPASSVPAGAWYHVVATYDGTATLAGTRIYVNGVDNTSLNNDSLGTGDSILTDASFLVGDQSPANVPMHGRIDDARVYGRALTPSEVKQLYNLGGAVIRP